MDTLETPSASALNAAWVRPAVRNILLLVLVSVAHITYVALTAPARLPLYLTASASVAAVVMALVAASRWAVRARDGHRDRHRRAGDPAGSAKHAGFLARHR